MVRTAEAITTLAVAALLASSHQPLLARQTPADTSRMVGAGQVTRLDPIEVSVSILPLGPAVSSGVPARISIVADETLQTWRPTLLTDALSPRAGISLYDDLGSPFKRTVVSRGFTSSPVVGLPQGISVFLDGIPVNEPDARQVNFDLLPLEHAARVEIVGGTAPVLGPNSLGGALNLVTRSGGGPTAGDLSVRVGSFGAYAAEGSWAGDTGGWSYYGGGSFERENGWRRVTGAERMGGLLNLSRGSASRGARVQIFGGRSYAETAGSLPFSVFEREPEANLTSGDFEDLRQLHLALSGYTTLRAGRASATVWARGNDAERFNVNQATDPDVRSNSRNRTFGAAADWRWTRPSTDGAAGVGARLGVSGAIHRTEVKIFAERLAPGITTHVQSPISEAGAFGQLDWSVGALTWSGALRLDAVRVPFRNRLDAARDTTSTYVQASPRGGVSWRFAPSASLYASIGRSFRAPAVIELACADPENPCPLPFALGDDPPLDPVTAVTYEAGGSWTRGALSMTAAAYRTEVANDIFMFPYEEDGEPEGSTIDGYFANVEKTRREGVEIEASLGLAGGHTAHAGWAYTNATFQVDDLELFSIRGEEGSGENEVEEGDRLPLVPAHTLSAGGDVQLPAGLEAGVEIRHVGRRWLRGDEANVEEPLDPYTVADLRAAWNSAGWTVRAHLGNVFERRYATFGTFNIHQATGLLERFLTPGEPRSLRVTLERRFGR